MQGHKTKVVLEIKERSKEDKFQPSKKSFSYLFVSVKLAQQQKNKQNHCKLHQTCGPESLKSRIKQQVFSSLIKMSGHFIKQYN